MRKGDPTMNRASKPAGYFAETAVGAVVLIALQFLSLPILVGGLVFVGIAKLFFASRTDPTRDHAGKDLP
jgi:hypothetical protein